MANRYWVGGTGTWNGINVLNWSTTSGGVAGATVPTAADDVFIDELSGQGTITFSVTRTGGRSLNFTGFTGTFIHNAAINMSLGDGTAGASNIALKMVPGMTYTKGNPSTSVINFFSSSVTQQTIDVGGKVLGNITINAPGASYLAVGPFYCWSLTLTTGTFTFDPAGGTASIIVSFVSTGASARTLNMQNVNLWLSQANGTLWNVTSSLVLNALGSHLVFLTANYEGRTMITGGLTYGSFTAVTDSFGQVIISEGGAVFTGDFTIPKCNGLMLPADSLGGMTVLGNLSLQGQDLGYQRSRGFINTIVFAPDSAQLSIIDDMDIRVKVALDDWTPASNQVFCGKLSTSNWSYIFYIDTAGRLLLQISTNGTSLAAGGVSTANLSALANGATKWVRATRRKSDGRHQYFTSDTGVDGSWTQLGTDVIVAANLNIFDGNANTELGSYFAGASPLIGNLYSVDIRNNVLDDGTGRVVFVDFASWAVGDNALTDPHGNEWVKWGNAAYGDGRILIWSGAVGVPCSITKPNGFVDARYLQLYDTYAKGGAHFYAGAASKIETGNKGWNLTDKPTVEQRVGMPMR